MSKQTSIYDRAYELSYADAEAAALRDVDAFSEWLGGHCYQKAITRIVMHLRDVTPEDLTTWDVPMILSLALDRGQPAQTRLSALDALTTKYLDMPSTKHWVELRAGFEARRVAEQMEAV